MKKCKKCKKSKIIVALVLVAVFAFIVFTGFPRIIGIRFIDREPTVTDKTLRFNEDGKFKIVQIADLQDNVFFNSMAEEFINELLDREKPDLVVLTGDNIASGVVYTPGLGYLTIDNVMSIFEEKGVKVAAVFGNHDAEVSFYGKDKQIELYKNYSCYIGDDVAELSGAGTYNIPVLSSKGDDTAFNLWFFDSQMYNEENDLGGYGCVQKDQVEWYVETENALTKANGGTPVPSLAFQHIIIPEVFDVLQKIEDPEDEQYKDTFIAERNGEYYVFPEEYMTEDTYFAETPCPPNYTNGQADALVENGNVLGILVGHDHKNGFVIPYKGMDIINSPACGFGSYGDMNRGARVIVLDENDLSDYETELVFFRDIFDMEDPENEYRYLYGNAGGELKILSYLKFYFKYVIEKLF